MTLNIILSVAVVAIATRIVVILLQKYQQPARVIKCMTSHTAKQIKVLQRVQVGSVVGVALAMLSVVWLSPPVRRYGIDGLVVVTVLCGLVSWFLVRQRKRYYRRPWRQNNV